MCHADVGVQVFSDAVAAHGGSEVNADGSERCRVSHPKACSGLPIAFAACGICADVARVRERHEAEVRGTDILAELCR